MRCGRGEEEGEMVAFVSRNGPPCIGRLSKQGNATASRNQNRDLLSTTTASVLYSPPSTDVAIQAQHRSRARVFLSLLAAYTALYCGLFAHVWRQGAAAHCAPGKGFFKLGVRACECLCMTPRDCVCT